MHKIRIKIPDEAYELLEQGAKETGSSIEDFALFCLFSVLANYAAEVRDDSSLSIPGSDGALPAHTVDAAVDRVVVDSDLTP